ncbi:MAG: histidine phosphatase family protein [Betaproteobacteria bacterium]|nr:histidine phosphatase family protein [Betaproteobacteria bacterium]NBU44727.1 histidine phosphatase family protein [Betaproteobacteria bacterium]
MDLILWRHAEANEPHEDEADMERPLTSRGERQAHRMARWLDKQLPEGTRIVCSPAVRAQQTLSPLGRKYKLRDELSPQCNHDHLLELVQWPLSKHAVLVVGHQPYLGRTAAKLLNVAEDEVTIRKGAVWWFRTRVRESEPRTVLMSVQNPDML